MGRYTGPKDKLSRREGRDLFGRSRPALANRLKQAPGQHGTKRGNMSQYGRQLREKQKIKRIYGMREKQFKKLYEKALKIKDTPTGLAILQLLESRLDNIVYKLGMAKTRPQARQMVTQGYILVDGEQVNVPSYIVKPTQTITLTPKGFSLPFIQEILKQAYVLPEWLEVAQGKGTVKRLPVREEMDQDLDENLVVAFYSK